MLSATRSVTFRDFMIFQIKLWLDGFKDIGVFALASGAMVLDFLAGRGRRPRLFYSVVRASEGFDRWLNIHSAVDRMGRGEDHDGLFGASEAGSDTLLGRIEQLVRGGDATPPHRPPGSAKRE